MIHPGAHIFNRNFRRSILILKAAKVRHQFPGVSEGDQGEGDIPAGVLICFTGQDDELADVADGFVVGVGAQCVAGAFDLEDIELPEMGGYGSGERVIGQHLYDQQVDALGVPCSRSRKGKQVFCSVFQDVLEVEEFETDSGDGAFVPVYPPFSVCFFRHKMILMKM